jgi:TonB family protein
MSPNPMSQGSSLNRGEAMGEDCKLKELDDPADCFNRLPLARGGSILQRTSCLLLVAAFLLITTHRLPAPIVESEEKATPAPEESAKPKTKPKAKAKSEESSIEGKSERQSTPRPSGKAKNLGGPSPQYPPEAAPLHLSGVGIYLLHFDQSTGLVTDVTVVQSAGSPLLDEAAKNGFRQWHEDPNCAKEVTMTMTFASGGPKQ